MRKDAHQLHPTQDPYGDGGTTLPLASLLTDDLDDLRAKHLLAAAAVDDELVRRGGASAFGGDPQQLANVLATQVRTRERARKDRERLALLDALNGRGPDALGL